MATIVNNTPVADLTRDSLFNVKGLVAVITGGGTGLGLMMAKALATNGAARVYVLGRRPGPLADAVAHSPHNMTAIPCDVTSKPALAAAAAQVEREAGRVDVLVCNSGIVGPTVSALPKDASIAQFRELVWSWDMADLARPYEVNVLSVLFTTVAFLELLDRANKAGARPGVSSSVLVTSSIAGFMREVVTGFPYVTTKAAAVSITKALATWCTQYGIRVNGIAPGIFPSEMTPSLMQRVAPDGKVSTSVIPTGRFGTEEDMAGTILYLASRAGAFLDGTIVVLDGGRLSIVPSSY